MKDDEWFSFISVVETPKSPLYQGKGKNQVSLKLVKKKPLQSYSWKLLLQNLFWSINHGKFFFAFESVLIGQDVAYQPKAENGKASSNNIQAITNFYGDNLNKSELSTQLQVFSSSLPKDVQIKAVTLHYILCFQQGLSTSKFEG